MGAKAWMFPLGKTGGLIEASMGFPPPRRTGTPFPLGKTGGLIEADPRGVERVVPDEFPLGKTGGLIEAAAYRAGERETSIAVSAG